MYKREIMMILIFHVKKKDRISVNMQQNVYSKSCQARNETAQHIMGHSEIDTIPQTHKTDPADYLS